MKNKIRAENLTEEIFYSLTTMLTHVLSNVLPTVKNMLLLLNDEGTENAKNRQIKYGLNSLKVTIASTKLFIESIEQKLNKLETNLESSEKQS